MAKLIIQPGTPQAREFELKPGNNYLGRGFANDLKIEDPSVSTSHAQIVLSGNAVSIKDLGSTNGTFINRSQIKEGYLQPGQTLRLGGVELLFEDVPVAHSVAPAPSQAPGPVRAIPSLTAPAQPVAKAAPVAIAIPAQPASAPLPAIAVARAVAIPVASPVQTAAPVAAIPVAAPTRIAAPSALTYRPAPTAAIEPVRTALEEPPQAAAAPGEFAEPPPGKSACKFHPNTGGQWLCRKCSELYCAVCVATKKTTVESAAFCRKCGTQCVPVRVTFQAKKGKELKNLTEGQVLGRSIGFGFGAAMASALLWILIAWPMNFDVPFINCIAVGAACGYAVKIACQDRPGFVFSLIAMGFTIVGSVVGKVGMVMVTHMDTWSGSAMVYSAIGLAGGLFLAWKIGGGDF